MGFDIDLEKKEPTLSKLALGTVQFGLAYGIANERGKVPRAEAKAILDFARTEGVDTVDTAIQYGDSEVCLGDIGIDDLKVVTKLPSLPEGVTNIENWVISELSRSLKRMRLPRVYGLLLHRSHQLADTNGKAIYEALLALKARGLVEKIGISIYSPEELVPLIPTYGIDLVQTPLNLIDRRIQNSGWLNQLKSYGIEIHARSIFLQGLLLMARTSIPKRFERWAKLWDRWHEELSKRSISAAAACLSLPLSVPEIDRVVVGVESRNQLTYLFEQSKTLTLSQDWSLMTLDDPMLINPTNWSLL